MTDNFDYYQLAQSWAPSFCCKQPKLCATIPAVWSASHLCLHGLWPSYATQREKAWPSNCSTQHKFVASAIPPLALEFAPNYHQGLAKHEWKEHGSCSGLSPEDYFKEGMRVMLALPRTDRGTPKVIQDRIGESISADEIRAAYPKQVAIKVNKECVLEEVTSCWSKREDTGKAGPPIDCPAHIINSYRNNIAQKKQCKNMVKINKLGTCTAKVNPQEEDSNE